MRIRTERTGAHENGTRWIFPTDSPAATPRIDSSGISLDCETGGEHENGPR